MRGGDNCLTVLWAICQAWNLNGCHLLSYSPLLQTHLNTPPLPFFSLFILFLTVHQPSFDPLGCIMHSQIKRTWQRINKQPHHLLLRDASVPSFWGKYLQTFVQFFCLTCIHCVSGFLPPTWDDCMKRDVKSLINDVLVCQKLSP